MSARELKSMASQELLRAPSSAHGCGCEGKVNLDVKKKLGKEETVMYEDYSGGRHYVGKKRGRKKISRKNVDYWVLCTLYNVFFMFTATLKCKEFLGTISHLSTLYLCRCI
jgi:hypothetical protein